MIAILLLLGALGGFVSLILAGCWLGARLDTCYVCHDYLPWARRVPGICAPCVAIWRRAQAIAATEAWRRALEESYTRGLWGPAVRRELVRAVIAAERVAAGLARRAAA